MKTRKSMTLAQGINSVLILLTLAVGSGAVSVNTAWCQLTTEEWVARYNAPYSGIDNAKDIAVDAAGNIYVTGSNSFRSSMGLGDSPSDYATVKYDAGGISCGFRATTVQAMGVMVLRLSQWMPPEMSM